MKRRIHSVNEEKGYFSVVMNGVLVFIYLTKRQTKQFMDYLDVGNFVKMTLTDNTKVIDKRIAFKLNYFISIERKTAKRTKVLYDLEEIREDILTVLSNFDKYLFIDLEMTMPHYYKTPFVAEIVQVGYLLTNNNLTVIKENDYYIKPTKYQQISKRTLHFLRVESHVFNTGKDYSHFYNDLKEIIKTHNPKIIVWGNNDIISLNKSYKINEVKPLTKRQSFINLLDIHKIYYQLENDLGLFNAYKLYYGINNNQEHDALDDAKVMLAVFKALREKKETNESF